MLTNAQLKVRSALYAIVREEGERLSRPIETADEVLTIEKVERIIARRQKAYNALANEVHGMLETLGLLNK